MNFLSLFFCHGYWVGFVQTQSSFDYPRHGSSSKGDVTERIPKTSSALRDQQDNQKSEFQSPWKRKKDYHQGASQARQIENGRISSSFVKKVSKLPFGSTQKPRSSQSQNVAKGIIHGKWNGISLQQFDEKFKGHERDQVANAKTYRKPNQTLMIMALVNSNG